MTLPIKIQKKIITRPMQTPRKYEHPYSPSYLSPYLPDILNFKWWGPITFFLPYVEYFPWYLQKELQKERSETKQTEELRVEAEKSMLQPPGNDGQSRLKWLGTHLVPTHLSDKCWQKNHTFFSFKKNIFGGLIET